MTNYGVDQAIHRRASVFVVTFAVTTLILVVCITYGLYRVALEQQSDRLMMVLESQISLINAVATFDNQFSADDIEGGAKQATLTQIQDSFRNLNIFGETGEFVLAEVDQGVINFLVKYHSKDFRLKGGFPSAVKMGGDSSVPMQLALEGGKGVVVARDYRGRDVLAAYGYIQSLNYGIVIKINMSEIREPFIELGIVNFLLGLGLDLLALFILRKISGPMIKKVAEREHELHSILQSSADGIMRFNEMGECTFANRSSLVLLGANQEAELLNSQLYQFITTCKCTGMVPIAGGCSVVDKLKEGKEVHRSDDCFMRVDGSCFPVAYSAIPIFNDGSLVGSVVTFNDITERKDAESQLQYLVIHDPLTGLLNRQGLTSVLTKELARSLRYKTSFSLLMLDLDHFKDVNDSYGHLTGDKLLRSLSDVVREHIRESDSAARYGGEEFVVVLPEASKAEAKIFAERLRMAVAEHKFLLSDEEECTVTVSVGVASYPEDGDAIAAILKAADEAMYSAKSAGRNCVHLFER